MCHVHLHDNHASAISIRPSLTLISLALPPTPHLPSPPSLLSDWQFSSTRTRLPSHCASILMAEHLWIAQDHANSGCDTGPWSLHAIPLVAALPILPCLSATCTVPCPSCWLTLTGTCFFLFLFSLFC